MTPTSSFEGEPTSSEPGSDINKGFQCMLKNDGKTVDTNPNAATMKMLQEMASVYDSNGDLWRTLSYRECQLLMHAVSRGPTLVLLWEDKRGHLLLPT